MDLQMQKYPYGSTDALNKRTSYLSWLTPIPIPQGLSQWIRKATFIFNYIFINYAAGENF